MKSIYSMMIPTEYGQMIVNRNDHHQTNALIKNGRAMDHGDIQLLATVISRCLLKPIVLDIGANIGTHSLGLRSLIECGEIHAFEAQRIIFNMLAGSVAINAIENVYVHHLAVGDREGRIEIPSFDYSKPLNFGSVEFGPTQTEKLDQPRQQKADPEFVRMTTIDAMEFPRVDLMKIDVEGMELAVLRGAEFCIAQHRPIMYVEWLKGNKAKLREQIESRGYVIKERHINYLCVPSEQSGRFTDLLA